ncbi:MAG: T9SS type A sorting domain-containing protein, partial [Nitrosopumilus sp.]
PNTTIKYQLPEAGFVNISIYNIVGQLVKTIVNEYKEPGYYTVQWSSNRVASGMYFYRITSGEYSAVKKCLILK